MRTRLTVVGRFIYLVIIAFSINGVITTRADSASQGLTTNGPYLLYAKSDHLLIMRDADGSGYKEIILPDDANLSISLTRELVVSPDGQWLAFHTHSSTPNNDYRSPDLTLNIMQLSDNKIKQIIRLVSPNYSDNFSLIAKAVKDKKLMDNVTLREITAVVTESFWSGIFSLAWSPDSQYLAFAGGMDGPSSDLYVYNVKTQTIKRISSGFENVQWIKWSAEGNNILYGSLYSASYLPCQTCGTWYFTNANVPASKTLTLNAKTGGQTSVTHWLSPTTSLGFISAQGLGYGKLRVLNFQTDSFKEIWVESLDNYAFDAEHNIVALGMSYPIGGPSVPKLPDTGLYFVYPATGKQEFIAAGVDWRITAWGAPNYAFTALNSNGLWGVGFDGTMTLLSSSKIAFVSASPDKKWLLGCDEREQGCYLFAADGSPKRKIHFADDVTNELWNRTMLWSPDSTGIFIIDLDGLFYVSALDATGRIVDRDSNIWRFSSLAWVKTQPS